MKIKPGVDIRNIRPETILGMMVVDRCYWFFVDNLVITSACDGVHMPTSLHYKGLAFDCRLPIDQGRSFYERTTFNTYADWLTKKFVPELKSSLGEQWDVVLEKDHIHIEFDPS